MLLRAFVLIVVLNFLATGHGGHHAGHHASLSAEELDEIRGQIIRSLGLNHEPDVSQVNVTAEEKAEAYEIYSQRLREKENGAQNDVDDEDSEELESFPAIVDSSSEEDIFPIRLHIPVRRTSSPPGAALLRVFKLVHNEPNEVLGSRWSHRASPPVATIFVYCVSPDNATLRSLVATQTIIVKDNEWEAIDVSPVVYSLNNTTSTGNVILDVDCEGCVVHGLQISLRPEEKAPALDLFWTASNDDKDNSISERKKRSLNRHGKKNKKQSAVSSPDMYNRSTWSGATDCSKGNRKKCCRHRMYVNFTHLRMDFVVEPKGFEAYYCKGKCPRLYNPAHTHALIQSTMHAWSMAPKPCCAPSKLSNLTIIHYDENKKLKVTDWTNAIVQECACS